MFCPRCGRKLLENQARYNVYDDDLLEHIVYYSCDNCDIQLEHATLYGSNKLSPEEFITILDTHLYN